MLQQINTENFQQMLSQFSTGELEGMIEKFPYFQQAHLLLAKKYQQENSPKFDQQLQLAALYIQDRELLYTLFNNKQVIEAPVALPLDIVEAPEEEKVAAEIEVEKMAEPEQGHQEVAVQKEEPAEAVENAVLSSPDEIALALAEIKQTIDAIQQIAEEKKVEEPVQTIEVVSAIEEPVLEETLTHADDIKEEKNEAILEVPQRETEEQPETVFVEPIQEENLEVIRQEAQEVEETLEEEEEPVATFSRIEPHTFDEWLDAFNNKSVQETPDKSVAAEDEAPDEELNQLLAANITVDYLHGLVKEETNYAKGLERFIEEQIQKHKQPEKKKKTAENDLDPELITETMAKVYEMQKKYAKAIKAYGALTLKFPEKSSLFAARINYLKNIL